MKRDNKNKATFILANVHLLASARHLDELFYETYAKALIAETASHFDSNYHNVTSYDFGGFKVDTNKEPRQVALEFKTYVEAKGVTYGDYQLHSQLKRAFTAGYFRRNGSPSSFKYSGSRNTDLVDLLLHVAGLKSSYNDYSEAYKFLEENKISNEGSIKKATIGNLTVTTFQNGRCDIAGLTDRQQAEINRLIAIHEKLKNAR